MGKKHYMPKDGSGRLNGAAHAPEYRCGFPGCGKSVTERSLMDLHHIVPRSMGGPDLSYNRMWLCPDHHRRIYVPGCPSGHHSVRHLDSIVVIGYLNSSVGNVLHYEDPAGVQKYWSYRLGQNLWEGGTSSPKEG